MEREQKGRDRSTVQADLLKAVTLLAADRPPPAHMVDHPLGGNWKSPRDCHIRPNLVPIYRKSDPPPAKPHPEPERTKPHLVRIGSRGERAL